MKNLSFNGKWIPEICMRVTGADFIIASVLDLVLTVAQLIATAEQAFLKFHFQGKDKTSVTFVSSLIWKM